jgi:hypothetical protein
MPTLRSRLLVACAAALATAAVCVVKQGQNGAPADFAMFWEAARVLAAGGDPYASIRPGGPYHWDSGYVYPITAAVALRPVAAMDLGVAAVLFSSLGMGLLAFALTRDGWQRWPVLLSAPALWAVTAGQWSPFLTAAALGGGYAWLAAVKPTLGVAAFLRAPSWRWLAVASVLPLACFLIMPDWPWRWVAGTSGAKAGNYHVPLLQPGGFLLALALVRWRSPDARLLLGMSAIPQTFLLYDQLPLLLLARTRIQAYLFALWSHLIPWAGVWVAQARPEMATKQGSLQFLAQFLTWAFYLPLLAIVLLRPTPDVEPERDRERGPADAPDPGAPRGGGLVAPPSHASRSTAG